MSFEHLDELGEVGQRAAEPVDLVDHDDVDQPGLDVAHQSLVRRPLQGPAGDSPVIVVIGQRDPALALLTDDVSQASFALGVEAVELLLQALFR